MSRYRSSTVAQRLLGRTGLIVAAAAVELPEKLLEQLAPGGRLIIPVGPPGRQDLTMVTRMNDHFEQVSLGAVSFVPLVAGKL